MFSIRLRREDLERFFTKNGAGDRLTLRSFIENRETEMHKEEIVRAGGIPVLATDEEPNFNDEEINDLVAQYLESMGPERVLHVGGHGSFNAEQLMDEVKKRTPVGFRIIRLVRADRSFVELQIKRGNFSFRE